MRKILIAIVFLSASILINAQSESKWKSEVEKLQSIDHQIDENEDVYVITGSSSARKWTTVDEDFPDVKMINNGFGGSQMFELLAYLKELVLDYHPDKVFIYEGDNDIGAGKTIDEIMKATKEIVSKIKTSSSETLIYFISPKPSIARWHLADQYIALNEVLKKYCQETENVEYIDVWYPMLDDDGEPMKDIFIEDNLHMNDKGYDIWQAVLMPYVNTK